MKVDEKSIYNEDPVFYCKRCHSLLIMQEDGLPDYCEKCGGTDIGEESIEEWLVEEEALEAERPHEKHLF